MSSIMEAALVETARKNRKATSVANYRMILMTMDDELQQANPNVAVLESCRRFLIEVPLPNVRFETAIPSGAEWGHA